MTEMKARALTMLDSSEFIIQALIEAEKLTELDAEKLRAVTQEQEMDFDEAVIRTSYVSTTDVAVVKASIC